MDPDLTTSHVLVRCGGTVARLLRGEGGPAEIDAAVADLHALPADVPARGPLAAGLIAVLVGSGRGPDLAVLRHLDGLLEIADRNPPDTPDWPRLRAAARSLAALRGAADGAVTDPRGVIAEVDAFADGVEDPAVRLFQQAARAGMGFVRAVQEDDQAAMRRIPGEVEELRTEVAGTRMAPIADVLTHASQAMAAQQRGDDRAMWAAFDQLRAATDALPADDPTRGALDGWAASLDMLRGVMSGGGPAPTEAQLAAVRERAQRAGATDGERVLFYTAAAAAGLRGGTETDPHKIDIAIDDCRRALAEAGADRLPFHLVSLGLGLVRRVEVTGRVEDLVEAGAVLTEARERAGGPQDPTWSLINECLAYVRRRRGETPDARRVALESLRSYAWKALLQSDAAAAATASRDAAASAIEIAHWCLVDNDPVAALRALDAGRGLILFAATELRDVVTRLADAGHGELADRWRAASGAGDGEGEGVPTELRREALAVLSGGSGAVASAALLDPPDLAEIQSALTALDADALVYLVPGTAPLPGWAVIAPARGHARFIPLPNLRIEDGVDVERYLAAAAAVDTSRDVVVEAAEARFVRSLDTLCDWAWRAAIGPLVEQFLAPLPRPAGRPPRVVLVPMGNLARVPWQAARRGDGTYALELAAFSQAASARMLCDSARLSPVALAPVGLVVGDPDTGGAAGDLAAARVEAYAIHQTFYRGGRYVGRRPDGTASRSGRGTGAEVRAWLASSSPAAGAMLHLACHGVITTTSYLLLADGDRLTVEQLPGTPERGVGLVVLAACRTAVSVHGYDEAYSLGTAFLASGVRSVLSTQWSIPDRATSVLMFMFHHFLADGLPVWAALRRAQLWMLDAGREVPPELPARLRAELARTDPTRLVA